MDKFRLDGKTALVTGASKGIGKAIARGLAEAGADVAIIARNSSQIEEAGKEIEALGNKVLAISCDISDVPSVERMVAQVHDAFGRIDILVNNAAINYRQATLDVTEQSWDEQMGVNVKGSYFCAQEVARIMKNQGKGAIINVGSNLNVVGLPNQVVYCISKGSLVQMTKAMALDLIGYNIRVNALGPGLTKTVMVERVFEDEETLQSRLARIPMHRAAEPEEMQGAVVYLASDASSYMTGQTVYVDGGWLANG